MDALIDKPFRRATREDAPLLAECVNHAGEGLPLYLWSRLADANKTAWQVGVERAQRAEGSFSYTNAILIEHAGSAAGCLIGYDIADTPEPIPADMPAMFRPLQELENLARGTWYVNVLAVLPPCRNAGLGSRLMGLAETIAQARGKAGVSLVVADGNSDAMRFYERLGFHEAARAPIVKEDWINPGRDWVLKVKR